MFEENYRLNGKTLKVFQFVDFMFLMWCSYLGHCTINYSTPVTAFRKIYPMSFEARLNVWPHRDFVSTIIRHNNVLRCYR